MRIVILDHRTTEVIFLEIPSDIEDIESYLSEHHGLHSYCSYMSGDIKVRNVKSLLEEGV